MRGIMDVACILRYGRSVIGKEGGRVSEYEAYGLEVKQARKNQSIYPFKMTHERVIERLEPVILGSQPKPTKSALSKIEHGHNLPSGALAAGIAIVLGAPQLVYKHPKGSRYIDDWIKITTDCIDLYEDHAANVMLEALLTIDEQQITDITIDQKAKIFRAKGNQSLHDKTEKHYSDIFTSEELAELDIENSEEPVSAKQRLISALKWYSKAEKVYETEGITPEKRVELLLQKAEAYFWSHEPGIMIEYALRAKTVIDTLITDPDQRNKYTRLVLWNICTGHATVGKDKEFQESYQTYCELNPPEHSLSEHARILSRRGGYYLFNGAYEDALDYFGKTLEFLGKAALEHREDIRASVNLFLYVCTLALNNQVARAKAILDDMKANSLRIHYNDLFCGDFILPFRRLEVTVDILGGGTYKEHRKDLETWYKTRSEEQLACASIDEIIAIAYWNQGEIMLAEEYYRDAIEWAGDAYDKVTTFGYVLRAERRFQKAFEEQRLQYLV